MIELLNGFSHDVVAIRAHGVLTSDDYDQLLVPAIESKLKDHATIKLWYEFGEQFEGISVETLWDDAKLGFFHLTDFSRIAIITDNDWLTSMAKVIACMVPCPVNVFSRQDLQLAQDWLMQVESV
ncbi:STAS/SEC14 domain-containing protein [Shewanella psychrotolerans]|uniref:STAS/SEC14 domain-containing protein n=1 Tax=Shewanella psychrotolerans TaxID=2864206 RepID=UPI001C66101E|nr:STAS/SEC14 domain-containing protein [Shewanella psychrotolerans]QYK00064.1 STAS/SEC14 domain-containing protein [Shewanella psychrotolerans]